MGIVNITPDSFSDGGKFLTPTAAVDHALSMISAGADIIDIGGESTRPGAQPVTVAEELDRVMPVIQQLRQKSDAAISIDTSKPEVMAAAAGEKVDLINDVRALQNPGAIEVASDSGMPVCLMHMKGEPRSMQKDPRYDDLIEEIIRFFEDRIAACEKAGISRDKLILDVGFGFGKTAEHNLQLVNRLDQFRRLGLPLLVGLSRKSTIRKIVEDHLSGSIGGALAAVNKGARILRVHDVTETVAALRVWRSFANELIVS